MLLKLTARCPQALASACLDPIPLAERESGVLWHHMSTGKLLKGKECFPSTSSFWRMEVIPSSGTRKNKFFLKVSKSIQRNGDFPSYSPASGEEQDSWKNLFWLTRVQNALALPLMLAFVGPCSHKAHKWILTGKIGLYTIRVKERFSPLCEISNPFQIHLNHYRKKNTT